MTSGGPDRALLPTCLTAALAALAPAVAPGQSEDADRPAFSDVVDVQLVNVEVWVSDNRGRPVTGLGPEDFEVREDGDPVTVDFFSEVTDAVSARPLEEAGVPAPEPESTAGGAVAEPAHLVLYFDDLHLGPASRKQAIEDLRAFLDEEKFPAERVLIFRQDRDLVTEAYFGSSREELDIALERIGASPGMGGQSQQAKRLAVQRLNQLWQDARVLASSGSSRRTTAPAPCESFVRRALPEVENAARIGRDRIGATLDHLTTTVRFLAALPGLKTLLYISDSLERSPGADLRDFITGVCPAGDRFRSLTPVEELSTGFHELTRHANANRVTIYSLQTNGLRSSFLSLAEQSSIDFQGANPFNSSVREVERGGMAVLADETGGRAIFNRNQFGGELEQIANEMASYYSLAYRPPHGGDRGEHQIRVRVRGRNLQVRHRRGYRDKSSDQRMSEQLDGALYLGLVENRLGVRLGAGRVRAAGGGKRRLPLHVMVPAARVAFLPFEDKEMAQIRVEVASRHAQTSKVVRDEKTFLVEAPPDRATRLLDLVFNVDILDGLNLVAVGVRDDATRETAFVSTTLAVGEADR
ncbi:MAG: VWA domain-containing protein [Acidobacteriota bacterium]|nr:VWA domain-containing protein [Acidobacteriota bacterium]MDE3266483.1 VWA domain-containing protein [Acidobacteriota bacterium]